MKLRRKYVQTDQCVCVCVCLASRPHFLAPPEPHSQIVLYVVEKQKKERKKRKTRQPSVSDSTTRNSPGAEDLRALWDLSPALRTRPADSAVVSQNAVCGVYSADPMAGAAEGQQTTKDSLAPCGRAWTSGYAGLMGTLGQHVGVPEVKTMSGISRISVCRFMYLFIFGFFRYNFGLTVHCCVNTVRSLWLHIRAEFIVRDEDVFACVTDHEQYARHTTCNALNHTNR